MERYFPVHFSWPAAIFVAFALSAWGLPDTEALPKKVIPVPIGTRLAQAKDVKAQELLLKEALKVSPQSPILNFHLVNLNLKRGDIDALSLAFSHVLSSPLAQNTRLMGSMFLKASAEEQRFLAKALIGKGFLDRGGKSACPFFELERRKERGELLYHMAQALTREKVPLNKLWHELFIKFPEVIDVSLLRKHEGFALWEHSLSIADTLERINNLMLFGKNKEAKESLDAAITSHPELSLGDRCALFYEGAKIERKLRHYKEAKKRFGELATTCSFEVQKKSRYMELQLTAMASDKSNLAKFDKFVSDYPLDGFSDDVLLWKATILLDNNEKSEALSVLAQLIKLFPEGDMIERALFLKAFTHAAVGESAKALAELTTLKNKAPPDSLEHAGARYWLARLSIYADLKAKGTAIAAKKAHEELKLLAKDESATLYSWLAYKLLAELKTPIEIVKTSIPPIKAELTMPNASLQFIEGLVKLGFNSEALALLNEEPLDDANSAQVAATAELYLRLGQPEAGHQKLIRCDKKIAASLKKVSPAAFDQISWPKPFEASVLEASARLQIPSQMITSVMRQESGFLEEALSWADARGAMQLILSTANEEAKRLGLEKIKPKDLFDPKLNILLGTSALKNYWLRFGTLPLALSAYNAGPAAAKKWQMAYKDMPLDVFLESIPFKETRHYLFAVLGNVFNYSIRDGVKLPAFAISSAQEPKAAQ